MNSKLLECVSGTRIILTANRTGHRKAGQEALVTSVFHDHIGFKTIPYDGYTWYAEPDEFEIIS